MGRSMDWERVHREDRLYRSFHADGGGTGAGRTARGGSKRSAAAKRGRRRGSHKVGATSHARRSQTQAQAARSESSEPAIQWRSDTGWVRRGPGGTWIAARPSDRITAVPAKRGKKAKRRAGSRGAPAAATAPSPPKPAKPQKPKQRVEAPRRGASIDKFFHQAREAQRAGSRAYADGLDPASESPDRVKSDGSRPGARRETKLG
jgi:hypothetical protein